MQPDAGCHAKQGGQDVAEDRSREARGHEEAHSLKRAQHGARISFNFNFSICSALLGYPCAQEAEVHLFRAPEERRIGGVLERAKRTLLPGVATLEPSTGRTQEQQKHAKARK